MLISKILRSMIYGYVCELGYASSGHHRSGLMAFEGQGVGSGFRGIPMP